MPPGSSAVETRVQRPLRKAILPLPEALTYRATEGYFTCAIRNVCHDLRSSQPCTESRHPSSQWREQLVRSSPGVHRLSLVRQSLLSSPGVSGFILSKGQGEKILGFGGCTVSLQLQFAPPHIRFFPTLQIQPSMDWKY